jgi:putative membrane protein
MRWQDQGLWIGLCVLVLTLLAWPMLGGGMMGWGMMGRNMMGRYPQDGNSWMLGLGMGVGWLVMLAFWAAMITLLLLAFRRMSGNVDNTRPESSETPAEILKRRYAAGDITRDQFEEIQRVLEGQRNVAESNHHRSPNGPD